MDADHEAWRTVEYLDSVTAATRSRLSLFWFPMAVFGLISIGAAVCAVVLGNGALGLFWFATGFPASLLTFRWYQNAEEAQGLVTSAAGHLLVVAVLSLGTFGLPLVVSGDPAWALALWTGAGYLAFAWLERSQAVAAVGTIFIVLGLFFWQVVVPHETALVSALTGITLLTAAAATRPRMQTR